MAGPLSGVRVVDLTQMVSGPMATMILADQGADVVKVEPPGTGDLTRLLGGGRKGIGPLFATTNRNKRSVVVNLKDSRGVGLVRRLVAGADVFVQNFRPGVVERLGLDESTLRSVRQNLVYVSITGFGEKGPWAHKRVYDPLVQALSGLADIQADRRTGKPRMMRLIVPDKVTALTAAQAITAALFGRERTGEGQHIRLSMLGAVIAFLWPEGMAAWTFADPDVAKVRRPQSVHELAFETADGWISVSAVSNDEWQGLCRAVGRPEWLEDERFRTAGGRVKHADARLELTGEVLRERATEDWLERLDREGVPCAPILTRDEVLRHEQVRTNGIVVEHEHPHAGRMREPVPAARFERTPAELRRPAPLLGQHTREVFAELGVSAQELDALHSGGVLGWPEGDGARG